MNAPQVADKQALLEEIDYWRKERNALILAHNYQIAAIQDLADYCADSLALSQKAAQTDNDLIIFCGVHFMAESVAIFSPEKTVLIPDLEAGCSLSASIDANEVRRLKALHPNAVVVSYVNTSAEVKAESDYCCTSSNAVRVVQSIPADPEIIFLPDMYLGDFVAKKTGRTKANRLNQIRSNATSVSESLRASERTYSRSRTPLDVHRMLRYPKSSPA